MPEMIKCTSAKFSPEELIALAMDGKSCVHISAFMANASRACDTYEDLIRSKGLEYLRSKYTIRFRQTTGMIRFVTHLQVMEGHALAGISEVERKESL
jgi:hypothetical protein